MGYPTGMTPRLVADLDLFADGRVVDPETADESCVTSHNPATGAPIAALRLQSRAEYDVAVERAEAVGAHWRRLPAPKRGEIVRQIGNAFRAKI